MSSFVDSKHQSEPAKCFSVGLYFRPAKGPLHDLYCHTCSVQLLINCSVRRNERQRQRKEYISPFHPLLCFRLFSFSGSKGQKSRIINPNNQRDTIYYFCASGNKGNTRTPFQLSHHQLVCLLVLFSVVAMAKKGKMQRKLDSTRYPQLPRQTKMHKKVLHALLFSLLVRVSISAAFYLLPSS